MIDVGPITIWPHTSPALPLGWFDEASKQRVEQVTVPIEAGLGHPTRIIDDDEHIRYGSANTFQRYAPLEERPEALGTE